MAAQGMPQGCTAGDTDSGLDSHTSGDCIAALVAAGTAAHRSEGYRSEAGMSVVDTAAAADLHIRPQMTRLAGTGNHPGMRPGSAALGLLLAVARMSAGRGTAVARTGLCSLRFALVDSAAHTDRDTAAGPAEIAGTVRFDSKTWLWLRMCDIRISARLSVDLALSSPFMR